MASAFRRAYAEVPLDGLFVAGASTVDSESVAGLQSGAHDPAGHGFTVQNVEVSLLGAVDPYLSAEAHLVFQIDREGESVLDSQHPHSWSFVDQPVVNGRLIDLALAQLAALGGAVALIAGLEAGTPGAQGFAFAFTLLGAAFFAATRLRDEAVPQKAIVGIIYAVSPAFALLILDRSLHGHEALKAMLVGSVLFVGWEDVARIALLCDGVGIVHFIFRGPFGRISFEGEAEGASARDRRSTLLWDFLFYATFGVVVTASVQLAGVLLIFSFLVIPAVSAMLFVQGVRGPLLFGGLFSAVSSLVGIYSSARFDLPTGAAIVGTFSVSFGLLFVASRIRRSGSAR